MSRGPPHRYNSSGERLRGYPPRYGVEFSGSYGYYGGPPYKRQRHHSSDDEMAPYGPAFYDPPFVRHQEVGLGEFNDFSSVSVEKDLKIHEEMEVEEILKDLSLTVKSDNLQLKAMGIPLSNSLQLLQCHPTPRKCLQDSHLDSSHQGHGLLHLLHQQALQ